MTPISRYPYLWLGPAAEAELVLPAAEVVVVPVGFGEAWAPDVALARLVEFPPAGMVPAVDATETDAEEVMNVPMEEEEAVVATEVETEDPLEVTDPDAEPVRAGTDCEDVTAVLALPSHFPEDLMDW